jgi:DNA-binding NtrC family response regulator
MNRTPFSDTSSAKIPAGLQILPWTSPPMRALEADLRCAIEADSNVMLSGERGSGKTFVAEAIHRRSRRRSEPFVTAGCREFAELLIESGNDRQTAGPFTHRLLTMAARGSVLIDGIEDFSASLQQQLLQFTDTERTSGVDLRLMTASTSNVFERVRSGQFRSDLFYRLNVIHLMVPALRDRPEDVPILFDHYLSVYERAHTPRLSAAARQWLVGYPWPGNVAELKAAAQMLAVQDLRRPIELEDLPTHMGPFQC